MARVPVPARRVQLMVVVKVRFLCLNLVGFRFVYFDFPSVPKSCQTASPDLKKASVSRRSLT